MKRSLFARFSLAAVCLFLCIGVAVALDVNDSLAAAGTATTAKDAAVAAKDTATQADSNFAVALAQTQAMWDARSGAILAAHGPQATAVVQFYVTALAGAQTGINEGLSDGYLFMDAAQIFREIADDNHTAKKYDDSTPGYTSTATTYNGATYHFNKATTAATNGINSCLAAQTLMVQYAGF